MFHRLNGKSNEEEEEEVVRGGRGWDVAFQVSRGGGKHQKCLKRKQRQGLKQKQEKEGHGYQYEGLGYQYEVRELPHGLSVKNEVNDDDENGHDMINAGSTSIAPGDTGAAFELDKGKGKSKKDYKRVSVLPSDAA